MTFALALAPAAAAGTPGVTPTQIVLGRRVAHGRASEPAEEDVLPDRRLAAGARRYGGGLREPGRARGLRQRDARRLEPRSAVVAVEP